LIYLTATGELQLSRQRSQCRVRTKEWECRGDSQDHLHGIANRRNAFMKAEMLRKLGRVDFRKQFSQESLKYFQSLRSYG